MKARPIDPNRAHATAIASLRAERDRLFADRAHAHSLILDLATEIALQPRSERADALLARALKLTREVSS